LGGVYKSCFTLLEQNFASKIELKNAMEFMKTPHQKPLKRNDPIQNTAFKIQMEKACQKTV
jgi:hypothetical protein